MSGFMINGLHCHISDGKYGFRTELLSVMYLNSVTIFFPTLLTLLGNAWFWYVMLLTRQYRIPACCWLAADHYRTARGERCWQDTTSRRGHVGSGQRQCDFA